MKITIEDVENEVHEYESGLYVFFAKDINVLYSKLTTMLKRIPRNIDSRVYDVSEKELKKRLRSFRNPKL
jgi:hypothetical protein